MNEFVTYQKFPSVETARAFADDLLDNGIECKIIDIENDVTIKYAYNEIDINYEVNIRQFDFDKADKLLESFYEKQIPQLDESYPLFNYKNDELLFIIKSPFDNDLFNVLTAKYILEKRGFSITNDDLALNKENSLNNLKKIVPVNKWMFFFGYLFIVFMPIISFFIGLIIYNNRNLLPNGKFFYVHSERDRKKGRQIQMIGFCFIVLYLILLAFKEYL